MHLPESIRTTLNEALNGTHQAIPDRLALWTLSMDFNREKNMRKLYLWLDMFGIPEALINLPFEPNEMNLLIKAMKKIKTHSGTKQAVKEIAIALGGTNVVVSEVTDFVLKYDGFTVSIFGDDDTTTQSQFNGYYTHDAAASVNRYLVDVTANFDEVANKRNKIEFKQRFKSIFMHTQPARISVRKIVLQ